MMHIYIECLSHDQRSCLDSVRTGAQFTYTKPAPDINFHFLSWQVFTTLKAKVVRAVLQHKNMINKVINGLSLVGELVKKPYFVDIKYNF